MRGRIFLFIFLALLLGVLYYLSFGYFSKGERAGTISKLSERGYVFKTYEGVLNEGGFSGETGTLTPRYWEFSAVDDSVIAHLKKALSTGERVTLTYQEKFFRFPWNGDTKYFVVQVHFLNPNGQQGQFPNQMQNQQMQNQQIQNQQFENQNSGDQQFENQNQGNQQFENQNSGNQEFNNSQPAQQQQPQGQQPVKNTVPQKQGVPANR